jgi:hypothetical protein
MGQPLEGRYANYFELGFSAIEFLLDFGQYDQDTGAAIRHTRIITHPESAKILLKMLRDVIAEFESKFGPIEEAGR